MDQRRIVIVTQDQPATASYAELLTTFGYLVEDVCRTIGDATAATAKPADLFLVRGGTFAPTDESVPLEAFTTPVLQLIPADADRSLREHAERTPLGYLLEPFTPRELHLAIELLLWHHNTVRAVDAAEEKFFNVAVDLLCHLDFSGYFRRLSPSWERTLGFTRDELMARPFIEFVHADDRARTLEQNQRVRGGEKALAFENRYMCKDGSFRWLRWNASPDTGLRTIYSVARDVTDAKRIEAERDTLVAELQTALAEVDTLQDFLPICSYCRKIRDDENYWQTVESYISSHTKTRFSHGICPSCMDLEVEPQLRAIERET